MTDTARARSDGRCEPSHGTTWTSPTTQNAAGAWLRTDATENEGRGDAVVVLSTASPCVCDLDRVLTQTAKIYAEDWKEMFAGFLRGRRERECRSGQAAVQASSRPARWSSVWCSTSPHKP